jgi:hypothetical protein
LKPPILFGSFIPSFDNGSPKPRLAFARRKLSGKSDRTVLKVCAPLTHGLGIPLSKVGFPIRKSADQSFFAAPHGLSQRSTSFIASQRQGIHRMPLRHLIALIINAHPARQRTRMVVLANGSSGRTLIRKTSLLRIVPTACGQAADMKRARSFGPCGPGCVRRSENSATATTCVAVALGAILPLHDVMNHARTKSLSACCGPVSFVDERGIGFSRRTRMSGFEHVETKSRLVEPDGIEPTTSCLQSRRSPN